MMIFKNHIIYNYILLVLLKPWEKILHIAEADNLKTEQLI